MQRTKLPPQQPQTLRRTAPVQKHPGGRPTDYRPEYAELAYRLVAFVGLRKEDLAAALGVTDSTIYNWCKRHKEFFEACNIAGRTAMGAKVVATMYRKAMGLLTTTEERTEYDVKGNVAGRVEITRQLEPNTAAQIFITKNVFPELYKDKRELIGDYKATVDTTSTVTNKHELDVRELMESLPEQVLDQLADAVSSIMTRKAQQRNGVTIDATALPAPE